MNKEERACSQDDCEEVASHRFTWPGADESFICDLCLPYLKGMASVLGMHLQTIPLDPDKDYSEDNKE